MQRNLEKITQDYWNVSHALRSPYGQPLGCGNALDALRSADKLRTTDWKLSELMHVINFDIIENSTRWRGGLQPTDCVVLYLTKEINSGAKSTRQ